MADDPPSPTPAQCTPRTPRTNPRTLLPGPHTPVTNPRSKPRTPITNPRANPQTPSTNPQQVLAAELASQINARYLRREHEDTGSRGPIPPELAEFMTRDNHKVKSVRPASAVIAALDGSDNVPVSIANTTNTMDGRDPAMDVSVDETNVPEGRLPTFSELDQESDEIAVDRAALREVLAILGGFYNNLNP